MRILETKDVTKSFGGIQALNACSISVEQGEIMGLIGPNGSGKTTLFNVITGYVPADAGEVRFRDTAITRAKPDKVFSLGIGRTFQLKGFARVDQPLEFDARATALPGTVGLRGHCKAQGCAGGKPLLWTEEVTGVRIHSDCRAPSDSPGRARWRD